MSNVHQTPTKAVQYVNLDGFPVHVPDVRKKVSTAPKRSAPDQFHKGFRVEGHPPGAMQAAQASREQAFAEWQALTDDEKRKRRFAGMREPKPWDEAVWLAKTKVKPVRSKPYELPAAADECAALAIKAGWLRVLVRPISKGKEEPSQ